MKTLKDKFIAILNSTRFWVITATALVAVINAKIAGSLDMNFVLVTVKTWLIAIAGVGTLDSIAEKSASKKA